MTREDLVRLIYFSDYCPKYNCQPTTRDICQECCSKALTDYENEIYNKALDDFRREINGFLCDSKSFADFVVTDGAIDCVIDKLKKGNSVCVIIEVG